MRLTGVRVLRYPADPGLVPDWFDPFVDDSGRLVAPHRGAVLHLLGAHGPGKPRDCMECHPCPDCGGAGWYSGRNRESGEQEQVQCDHSGRTA